VYATIETRSPFPLNKKKEPTQMRKIIAISAIAVITTIVLMVQWYSVVQAGPERGQQLIDKYLNPADHSSDKVKFHLLLHLTTGNWNDAQRAIILRGINDRASVSEAEVAANFSHDEAGSVFYNPGSFDIEDLRHIYALPFGKSQEVRSWTAERKHRLWQMNAALTLVRYDLHPDQQQFVVDFAAAIPTITRENAGQWNQRAVDLQLPRQVGRALLTTIGDDRCPGQFAAIGKPKMAPSCVCTTSAGNWSCNDSCHGEGSCTLVPGDCGILWLYDCNGMCNNGDMEIQ
jgi:hypothetical protein